MLKPAVAPAAASNGGQGGTLVYDGNTTRLEHVRCWASKTSPAVRLYFTDTAIPPAASVAQAEIFLYDNRVTQIRLVVAIAEIPPRIVDAQIEDFKSKTNSGMEKMTADQPPYVFEDAVADDAHVAGTFSAKGAKTDPNEILHSFDLRFDVKRADCR